MESYVSSAGECGGCIVQSGVSENFTHRLTTHDFSKHTGCCRKVLKVLSAILHGHYRVLSCGEANGLRIGNNFRTSIRTLSFLGLFIYLCYCRWGPYDMI